MYNIDNEKHFHYRYKSRSRDAIVQAERARRGDIEEMPAPVVGIVHLSTVAVLASHDV